MTALFFMVAALFGLACATFILIDKRVAVGLCVVALGSLWMQFQGIAGVPADADARLSQEQWQVVSIAQMDETKFLVSVRYPNTDLRTYVLDLPGKEEKDKFLKAGQAAKKGMKVLGKALRPRIGQQDDGGMSFEFREAQEVAPKP